MAERGGAPRRRVRLLWVSAAGLVAVFLGGVGPWPARGRVDLSRHAPTRRSLEALAASAARSRAGPGSFRAGWARRVPELPGGIPLAGYSARGGRPSTGQRDPIDVEALVVSDGRDHAAIVASDLLIVPPGVARRVRASVAERTGLAPDDLLLNASHTHSGPGAFAAGWLAEQSAGRFDAGVETALADAFVGAIAEAWAGLEPARVGHGRRSVPEQVTNRTRPGGRVDADLQLLLVEQADGDRLVVACYAAHPTLLPASNLRLSADYPGSFERALERAIGVETFFLSGAVGSMGPRWDDEAASPEARAEAYGGALAAQAAGLLPALVLAERVDVASASAAFRMPVLQVRLGRWFRWSPFLVRRLGVEDEAWLSVVRIGDLVLAGTPGDLSGEIAVNLKARARERGVELWVTSFDGAYVGYISPDHYYETASREGLEGYEMYTMSWGGPQQEELLSRLVGAALDALEVETAGESRAAVSPDPTSG